MSEQETGWYAVRCVFHFPDGLPDDAGPALFEERITLWQATSLDEAIVKAEADAAEYAETLECNYAGLAQAYWLPDEPKEGAEVFSLMRDSSLNPSEYLNRFFDDGNERQNHSPTD